MARYAAVFAMLKTKFIITGAHLAEIGGGFGGLAALVCTLASPASYAVLDLPETAELVRRFAWDACRGAKIHFAFATGHDLVVSTCAFSELHPWGRRRYEPVLSGAHHGFIVWSTVRDERDLLTCDEVAAYLNTVIAPRCVNVDTYPVLCTPGWTFWW